VATFGVHGHGMPTSTRPEIRLTVPHGWHRSSNARQDVLLAAHPRTTPASGVRPSLTLCCESVPDDLATWRARALTELAGRLDDFELEDEDDVDLDGHQVAYRRFSHRSRVADLLCDQWAWLVDGFGLVLTGTVAREDYPDLCDVFELVAETLDPRPRLG
jgi:hypothetical protein